MNFTYWFHSKNAHQVQHELETEGYIVIEPNIPGYPDMHWLVMKYHDGNTKSGVNPYIWYADPSKYQTYVYCVNMEKEYYILQTYIESMEACKAITVYPRYDENNTETPISQVVTVKDGEVGELSPCMLKIQRRNNEYQQLLNDRDARFWYHIQYLKPHYLTHKPYY